MRASHNARQVFGGCGRGGPKSDTMSNCRAKGRCTTRTGAANDGGELAAPPIGAPSGALQRILTSSCNVHGHVSSCASCFQRVNVSVSAVTPSGGCHWDVSRPYRHVHGQRARLRAARRARRNRICCIARSVRDMNTCLLRVHKGQTTFYLPGKSNSRCWASRLLAGTTARASANSL